MTPQHHHRAPSGRRHGAVLALVVALLLSGCAGDDGTNRTVSDGAATTGAEAPSTSASPDHGTSCDDPLVVTPTSTAVDQTTSTEVPAASQSTTTAPCTTSTTEPPASTATSTTSPTTSTATSTLSAPTTIDETLLDHQRQLTALGYWVEPADGRAGPNTAHAVTAFQKAEGLPRTGELDTETIDRLAVATTPTARSGGGTVLEIDLARQLLLVVDDGTVARIYNVATGATATPTPAGQFAIDREIDGIRNAPVGRLYRPKYFNGGIALRGYTSVPPQRASHGCVRLTYAAMDDLWGAAERPSARPSGSTERPPAPTRGSPR